MILGVFPQPIIPCSFGKHIESFFTDVGRSGIDQTIAKTIPKILTTEMK